MKQVRSIGKNKKGFATIEVLIAFVILILCIGAVIMVVFGNQSVAIDNETNNEAIMKAQKMLEDARAEAKEDFNITEIVANPADFFPSSLDVLTISECAKKLTSEVTWGGPFRPLEIDFSTIVTNLDTVALLSYCDPISPGDWDEPEPYGDISPSVIDGQGTGVAVAYINGIRYAFLTTDASNPVQDNFYVIDTTTSPEVIDASDIYSIKVEDGLEGIATAKIDGNYYAFVVTDHDDAGQLQVVDISVPTSPTLIPTASTTIPNVTPGESAPPLSIFYYNEKIYIGTEYLAFGDPGFNHEFHVFDVSNPSSLPWPRWETSIDIDRNVNDIFVKGDTAYLATGQGSSPYTPLQVVDLPTESVVNSFSTGINKPGTAVFVLGDTLYFGTESGASGDDFYIFDINDLDPELSANSLDGSTTEVGDIFVQGQYAFIGLQGAGAQDTFQVWNIGDPEVPERVDTVCPSGFPLELNGLVFIENYIMASFRSYTPFRIIYNDATSCP